jgi:hypothetical protein
MKDVSPLCADSVHAAFVEAQRAYAQAQDAADFIAALGSRRHPEPEPEAGASAC